MDNIVENSGYIIMADDGMGDPNLIPSVFISETDGETLLTEISKLISSSKPGEEHHPLIIIDFINQKFPNSSYSFYLN